MTTTRETADHAELARRLREDADWQRKMKGGTTNDRMLDQAADALDHLLSEIAALRVREAALIDGKTDMFRRATRAERQRDELRKAWRDDGIDLEDFGRIVARLANQGADQ